jgi:hypothetical protein
MTLVEYALKQGRDSLTPQEPGLLTQRACQRRYAADSRIRLRAKDALAPPN